MSQKNDTYSVKLTSLGVVLKQSWLKILTIKGKQFSNHHVLLEESALL